MASDSRSQYWWLDQINVIGIRIYRILYWGIFKILYTRISCQIRLSYFKITQNKSIFKSSVILLNLHEISDRNIKIRYVNKTRRYSTGIVWREDLMTTALSVYPSLRSLNEFRTILIGWIKNSLLQLCNIY